VRFPPLHRGHPGKVFGNAEQVVYLCPVSVQSPRKHKIAVQSGQTVINSNRSRRETTYGKQEALISHRWATPVKSSPKKVAAKLFILQGGAEPLSSAPVWAEPSQLLLGNWLSLDSHMTITPFYKRGCQDKSLPCDGKAQRKWSCRPAPVMNRDAVIFLSPQIHGAAVTTPISS